MSGIEQGMADVAHGLLMPVLALIAAALAYALLALGAFMMEAVQRRRGTYRSAILPSTPEPASCSSDDIELRIMKRLEWLRIVSRTAPMLGLVATMIPMGPALMALSQQRGEQVAEHLVVAFSAVILALIGASITFFILTVRRRWLLEELQAYERDQERNDALS